MTVSPRATTRMLALQSVSPSHHLSPPKPSPSLVCGPAAILDRCILAFQHILSVLSLSPMVRGGVLFGSPASPHEVASEPGRYVSRRQGQEGEFVMANLKRDGTLAAAGG